MCGLLSVASATSQRTTHNEQHTALLTNYFKIALRNLVKNKSHTFINVGGLAIGMVCALVIFLIIQFEYSFNTGYEDSDRIYRIVRESNEFGQVNYDPGVTYPLPDAVRNDFPEMEAVALVDQNYGTPVLSVERSNGQTNKFRQPKKTVFVQPQFLEILSFDWVSGNPGNALNRPNTVIISKGMAQKLFGTQDVLGKIITLQTGSKYDLEVIGVVKDPPRTSDFPFELLVSYNSKDRAGESRKNDNWGGTATSRQCYVKLKKGIDPAAIEARMDAFIAKYYNEEVAKDVDFLLQPLGELHFDTRFETYSERTISHKTLLALGLIGLLLLLTACINFINLNTAIAVRRSKEVGIRKALGGTRGQLATHFLGETAIITLLSLVIAVALTEVAVMFLEPILGFSLEVQLLDNIPALLFLAGMFVAVTLAAGLYPAMHLSGMQTIEAIRNKITASYGEGLILRRTLVVAQFAISQLLIIGTIVISTQMSYFRSVDMGFTKEAIVEVPLPFSDESQLPLMKTQLAGNSSIKSYTFSNTGTANGNTWFGNYMLKDSTEIKEGGAQIKFVDSSFVNTYELEIIAGQNLENSDSVRQYLVNETFVREVGYGKQYHELIGKYVEFWGREAPIVGVVKDFNTQSLHEELKAVLLASSHNYMQAGIKINMQQSDQTLAHIEKAFETVFPEYVFEYTFLDDRIAGFYEQERRTAKLMNIFTVIAIVIGCLGLFGLVSYMAATRTKEIGVRKVLGATVMDIIKMFGREFALLIVVAFLIAAPLAFYLMNRWLAEFAYRIELGAGLFMLAFVATALIAACTVSYKSLRTAYANPVESLKSE